MALTAQSFFRLTCSVSRWRTLESLSSGFEDKEDNSVILDLTVQTVNTGSISGMSLARDSLEN